MPRLRGGAFSYITRKAYLHDCARGIHNQGCEYVWPLFVEHLFMQESHHWTGRSAYSTVASSRLRDGQWHTRPTASICPMPAFDVCRRLSSTSCPATVNGVDWWTRVFAAVAAIAAIFAAAWAWTDRPQPGWHIHMEAKDGTPFRKPIMTFAVRAVGTAVAQNVEVRVAGALHCESRKTGVFQPQMGAGSEPFVVDVWLSGNPGSQAYVEIIWTRLRPYLEKGQRVEVHSMNWEVWQWRWSSIRICPRPGSGRWTKRLVRTSGNWVPARRKPRAEIPCAGEP
jgi:hypothetical protein